MKNKARFVPWVSQLFRRPLKFYADRKVQDRYFETLSGYFEPLASKCCKSELICIVIHRNVC